ncbi:MAG: hypothetical protein OK452_09165 [Thaumarchaeota archaeon]|nr:hypothetical protein [Nitrososphaerota archaeon]
MTTSDSGRGSTQRRGRSRSRALVITAVVGAAIFGLYVGYLALTNDSFPAQQRPFDQYARVVSSSFNGTEFAFQLRWLNGSYLPLYAQLTSPASDSANTPVCETQLTKVASNQTLFMPFTISPPSATLTNVDLSIAVQSLPNGGQFTIVYNFASTSATNAAISPSNYSCHQPTGIQ